MRRNRSIPKSKDNGVIITLVAVFMLGVVGAMAALSIDVVTLYTARSEAQLAADAAALAGARVLANSGATSDSTGTLLANAEVPLAKNVAIAVARQNDIAGSPVTISQITVSFGGTTNANPTVTVRIQKPDLPVFFARIWGTQQLTVAASATAEAYNPTNPSGTTTSNNPPVATICVKPWLLPNMDPSGGTTIFDKTGGSVTNSALLGWTSTTNATRLRNACTNGNCTTLPVPTAWKYYPGDTATTFQPPTQALPACNPVLTTDYEKSIAGCVQTPIACNGTAGPAYPGTAYIDVSNYGGAQRYTETANAVNCLTHAKNGGGDTITTTPPPTNPFDFVAGADNPVPGTATNDVMISDSLVTVPVFDSTVGTPPTNPVQIIGFVQLFLNPDGAATPPPPAAGGGHVNTTVINMVGCGRSGTGAALTPILGNGASPVVVRLISP